MGLRLGIKIETAAEFQSRSEKKLFLDSLVVVLLNSKSCLRNIFLVHIACRAVVCIVHKSISLQCQNVGFSSIRMIGQAIAKCWSMYCVLSILHVL